MALSFTFDKKITIGQIQLFAKVVKQMMMDEFSLHNVKHLIQCPIPQEFGDDWKQLNDFCAANAPQDDTFYISTPEYRDLKYSAKFSRQLPDVCLNMSLHQLQNVFHSFYKSEPSIEGIGFIDTLENCFILTNSNITNYFLYRAFDNDDFDWNEKYRPSFVNLDLFRSLRGTWNTLEMEGIELEKRHSILKWLAMPLLAQCRFLAFWCTLIDVATFPGLDAKEKAVMEKTMGFFLKNLSNVYLTDIIVEANPLDANAQVDTRGKEANTTRIKLAFHDDNFVRRIIRFDLPHKGEQYAHLNIDKINGNDVTEASHFAVSDTTNDCGYDHCFNHLCFELSSFNYAHLWHGHESGECDNIIIQNMALHLDMCLYAISANSFLYFNELSSVDRMDATTSARHNILNYLASCGHERHDLDSLSPIDILEIADLEITQRDPFNIYLPQDDN